MLPQGKVFWAASAVSATNGGTFTSSPIDTLGASFAKIDILASTQAASTQLGSPSVLKLQECDTTVASSFVDIVGFRGGVDFTIGIGSTALSNGYTFNVDCRARKRFLSVVAVPATTQTWNVVANTFRNEQSPVTATKAGVLNLVEG